jgi:hypothetical protein
MFPHLLPLTAVLLHCRQAYSTGAFAKIIDNAVALRNRDRMAALIISILVFRVI